MIIFREQFEIAHRINCKVSESANSHNSFKYACWLFLGIDLSQNKFS